MIAPGIAARFSEAGPEAAPLLARAMGLASPIPIVERFAGGRRCYVAHVEGTIASYGWVSFHEEEISEIGMRIRPAPGDAYIWDCATLPAYRGHRLFPALLSHILLDLRTAGFRRVWIGANTESLASQKGFILAGFLPIADLFLPSASPSGRTLLAGRPGVPEDLVAQIRGWLSLNPE